ncbi:methyltransferase domain-containing protein [Candidatus Shapirobacteria bacterium]|nr:methyltransferase domain-containing protein [Candidatus Shapirobacteria bacterium]
MAKEKHQYYFVLGTNHSLCKADIINVLAREKTKFLIAEASEEILIIETKERLDARRLINTLGSAVKIGEIFKKCKPKNFPNNFLKEAETEEFKKFFLKEKASRPHFAISVYNGGGGFKSLNRLYFLLPKIGRFLKERTNGIFFYTKERKVPSFLVDQKKLLQAGFELVLTNGRKNFYAGKTLALQDYQSYSFRDYQRPQKDPKSGMIPPKLAKIMINLAGEEKDQTFLDPFCGSGTFLQELILLGYKNIIGADKNPKAIEATKKNLDWLFSQYSLEKKDYRLEILKSDVALLYSFLPPESVDAVVSEPYLGSPQAKYFSLNQIRQEINRLSPFYLSAFRGMKPLLKKDAAIVIIFPVFKFKNQFFQLEILEKLRQLGFFPQDFVNPKIPGAKLLNLKITPRRSIIFFRPGQTISREIFIFKTTNNS